MKITTALFISALLFISCSCNLLNLKPTDIEIDQTLIELNKEPVMEGVFATMATQLSTEGGFHRVLAVLHQLVADGKKQLHGITKTWRRTRARCQVSKVQLLERQEFFAGHLDHAERTVQRRKLQIAETKDTKIAYKNAKKVYTDLLRDEISRHAAFAKYNEKHQQIATNGIKLVDQAIKALNDWTPKDAAFVQTMMTSLLSSYNEVTEGSLDQPTELIERSKSDNHVKARLLQWFKILKTRLMIAGGHFVVTKEAKASMAQIEKDIATLVKDLGEAGKFLRRQLTQNNTSIKHHESMMVLLQKLITQNSSLIKSNKAYCLNERVTYHRVKGRITNEIALFREIIKYFRDHYARVHEFIRAKYNH